MDPAIAEFVKQSGLLPPDVSPEFEPLQGGVSSDIWRVRGGAACFCVKRALPKLRVAADWFAPVERNASEVAWLEQAGLVLPEAVPRVLASDATRGIFAMSYLPPGQYEPWKSQLRRGEVSLATAGEVGSRLASLHSAFARARDARRTFATDDAFYALRLEPYLVATSIAHPDLEGTLRDLAARTAATRLTVAHGDVSPKNILVGPSGPVFIDAECAWFGDPAFDVAFCLNHLLLKTFLVPASTGDLLQAFDRLRASYTAGVDWEEAADLDLRAARLLPGLLLARVDGKSPVEYLDTEPLKSAARRAARTLLLHPADGIGEIGERWPDLRR